MKPQTIGESADLLLGNLNSQPWYQKNPNRFKEEKRRMRLLFPNFKLNHQGQNIFWEGSVGFSDKSGTYSFPENIPYNPLPIQIICSPNYPVTFPTVIDLKGVLVKSGCEHIMKGDRICYAFRPSTELDFEKKHYISDLIPVIQTFLLKWYCKDRLGKWPGGEHLHGVDAIIIWELEHGELSTLTPCPCTLTNDPYQKHCLKLVQQRLAELRARNSASIIRRDIGRNDLCLCNSGKKYKKCGLLSQCLESSRVREFSVNPTTSSDQLVRLLTLYPTKLLNK